MACKSKSHGWEIEAPPPDTLEELRALGYVEYAPTPADLSKSGATIHDPSALPAGYFAYGAVACHSKIIDATGSVLNQWSLDNCVRWRATELLPSGDLLVVGVARAAHGGEDSYLARLSWRGELAWQLDLTTHHDVELLANGDLLVLTTGRREVPGLDAPILDDRLTIVSPAGDVLRSYSMYDMVVRNTLGFELADVPKRKNQRDALHTNSVHTMTSTRLAAEHPIYAVGNVLVASRRQNALMVFNLEKRRLIWAWGPGELDGPHDGTVLADGNFLLFDNGWHRGWSRVIELDPLSRKIVWQYRGTGKSSFFSKSRGSGQRLATGQTLIGNSNSGQALLIDPDGKPIWEFNNPKTNAKGHRGAIIRMRYYDATFIERMLAAAATKFAPSPGH
jgi:hypothetical protein